MTRFTGKKLSFQLSLLLILLAVDSYGLELSSEQVLVRTSIRKSVPVVARDSVNNRFLIAFKSQNAVQPSQVDIYYQLTDTAGLPLGEPKSICISGVDTVNEKLINPANNEASLAAAFDPDGGKYLAVYSDAGNDPRLLGQFINPSGNKDGIAFEIFTGQASNPRMVFDQSTGNYLVIWSSSLQSGASAIYGRMISGTGGLGAGFSIESATDSLVNPAIGYDSVNHRFLVVWQNDSGLNGQLVKNDGTFFGEPFLIFSERQRYLPSIAFDPNTSRFLVAWNVVNPVIAGHTSDIIGQLFSSIMLPENWTGV